MKIKIGQLSLSQVLLALVDTPIDYWCEPSNTNLVFSHLVHNDEITQGVCKQLFVWDLTKNTLEEQNEETQKKIEEIITKSL